MNIEVWVKEDEKVRIMHDEDCESPREWDNEGVMVILRLRNYRLGDRPPLTDNEEEEKSAREDMVVLPIYKYEHSGITISTSPYSCTWDSGKIGFIYREIKEGETREQVTEWLESEVNVYREYLEGKCYYFIREKKNICECCKNVTWELIDSCGGFIGDLEKSGLYASAFPEGMEGWTQE